jgi:hypothetical protein
MAPDDLYEGVNVDATGRGFGESESAIVRETDPAALAVLSEDELLDLHARVRRARNKYVGQYRRQGSARVQPAGGRGKARPQNQSARDRAEVLEAALARVSTALARAARASAAELKAERLEAARAARAGGFAPASAMSQPRKRLSADRRPPEKSSGRIKKDASSIAAGKRRQAKRDSS